MYERFSNCRSAEIWRWSPRFTSLVAGLLLLPAAMQTRAEAADPWYLSVGLGANYGQRAELDGLDIEGDYDLGLPRVEGGVGRRFGEHWRAELALSQRKTKAEFFYPSSGGPSGDPGPNDRFTSVSAMLSVVREFQIGSWLKPHVGFGIGPTWLTYQLGEVRPGSPEETYLIDDDDMAMTYQATAGFRFPLTRSMDLGLRYEYWRTPDVGLEDVSGDRVRLDQTIHSGWLDLYWYPGSAREAGWGATRSSGPAGRGFYISGNLGIGWPRDSETESVTFDAFAPGGLMSVALGRTLGRRWRVEGEYVYRSNEPQLLDFGYQLGERRSKGQFSSSSLGLNVNYDFMPDAAVQPTVGLGAGFTRLDYDIKELNGTAFIDDRVSAGYVQAIAGFDIELTRRLTLHAAWRVWLTDEHKVMLADGSSVSADHWVHSVETGLRFQLRE